MLDVAIIGGGPIGSRTAYKLTGMGYRVAVLEKNEGLGQKSCCTGIVSSECLSNFEIPSHVIFRLADSAKIFSPSGEFLRVSRSEPQAGIVNRPAFDRYLAEKAQSRGAEYYLNCRAQNISFLTDRVQIEAQEKGCSRRFEAQSVVLAVGFGSSLVNKLGLGRVGYCVGGAQIEVATTGVEEVEVYFDQDLSSGFFAWLVPTLSGRCLAGILTRQAPGRRLRNWLSRLEAQGKIVPEKVSPIRHGGIPLIPLSRTYRERLLVVGDAAGQVKPTTGGGLYFGMLCADIAAGTLHEALRSGDLSLRKLSQYDKHWRRKIGSELRAEYLARRAYERLSNKQIDGLILRLKSSGVADALLHDKDFSFDWHGGLMMKALKYVALSRISRLFSLHK